MQARDVWPLALVAALVALGSLAGALVFTPSDEQDFAVRWAAGASGLDEEEPEPRPLGSFVSIEDPSGHALDALYAALARAERGESIARLLFYGGSHTAGDLMVGSVRERLQQRFGDSGHGFVPLVPCVEEQWTWGLNLESEGWEPVQVGPKSREIDRYGLAGMAFLTDEVDAFAAVESAYWGNGREASRFTLLYDRRAGGGSLDVLIDRRRVDTLRLDAPVPTAGTALYRVSDATHRFEVRAHGDGPVTIYGAILERDRPGVVVENLGLVGAKARHHLWWEPDQWRGFFVARRPDLFALVYGVNETDDDHLTMAQHEAQLRQVLGRLREAAPDASCLIVGPTDRPTRRADGTLAVLPVLGEMAEMQRRVAFDESCAYFDTLAFQGGLGAGIRWVASDPPHLRDDLIHLSSDAYKRWGDVLASALLENYGE